MIDPNELGDEAWRIADALARVADTYSQAGAAPGVIAVAMAGQSAATMIGIVGAKATAGILRNLADEIEKRQ